MKCTKLASIAIAIVTMGQLAQAGPVVAFALTPADGYLAGQAGSSVGWGFSITTDSDYVTIESITFGDLTPVGTFTTPGLPSSVASVGMPISTTWVQGISGLQYDIAATSGLGVSSQGVMTLVYDAFTDAGLNNQIVFANTVNAQYNGADVNAEVFVNAVSPVPEPTGTVLAGLVSMLFCIKAARRRQTPAGTPDNYPSPR